MIVYTNDFFASGSSYPDADLVQLVDNYTFENVNFKQTTVWIDGSPITSGEVDDIIYRSRYDSLNNTTIYYVNTIIFSGKDLNAKSFGVKADGVTADHVALQKAVNTALKLGLGLTLPNGKIWLTDIINVDLSLLRTNKIFNLHGQGIDNTELSADNQESVLNIIGQENYVLDLSGFTVKKSDTPKTGVGVKISKCITLKLIDIRFRGFYYGLVLLDCVSGIFERLYFFDNVTGILGQRVGNFTNPNLLNFVNCSFSAQSNICCEMVNLHNVKFDTCSIEGNNKGLIFSFNAADGKNSVNIINTYFEGNASTDLYINMTNSGSHNIYGCIFNRSILGYTHNIVFENQNNYRQVINMVGNAFKNAGNYVITNNIPPVGFIGTNYNILDTNIYDRIEDQPDYTNINVITLI